MQLVRQHLIDPEICIRCNTCEETCPIDAITHNEDNYVVDPDKCDGCNACISPCPTGAIDSWRMVSSFHSLEEQMQWDELPDDEEGDEEATSGSAEEPEDVARIRAIATAGEGAAVPPFSAAHPYVNLYSPERPAIARVAGNVRITDESAESDVHHIVLDFRTTAFPVLEGQSIGIIPPGTDSRGRPHHVRLFSVASPRDGERPGHNNLSLTVKRVVERREDGEFRGVASNYLCDLERGDEVKVTGPYGTTFLMPNHQGAKIIMICTGTGSAPMRAMTEHHRRLKREGFNNIMLFFGSRTPGELPYFGPLMKLPRSLIDVELAFSRAPDRPREYVQDRMRRRADELAEWLASEDTYIYICGLKGMEDGCRQTLAGICSSHGMNWDEMLPGMIRGGRFHVETY